MKRTEAVASLTELGFTELESRAYVSVLESGPVTGYRVAQHIGKAGANTYKALESLARRGAIVCDRGETALYRAIPPETLARRLSDQYAERSRRAAQALAHIGEPRSDHRVYRIENAGDVYERCAAMLREARVSAFADVFPAALARVRPLLEAAARRGVTVAVKTYEPAALAGAITATDAKARATLERWPGEWLNLAVDGSATLLAFFEPGGEAVRQAVWTDSPYISVIYQSALAGEIGMAMLHERFAGAEFPAAARRALREAAALGDPSLLRRSPVPHAARSRAKGA
jgi:HTH-type transcriptional regulator, sugar sensing transcriptional regulator